MSNVVSCDTIAFDVFVAGSYQHAIEAVREFCLSTPLCVSVTPSDFVYVAGMESGVVCRVLNYPRFTHSSHDALEAKAMALCEHLIVRLHQRSGMVVGTKHSHWLSRDVRTSEETS